jgi:hypothetical protein
MHETQSRTAADFQDWASRQPQRRQFVHHPYRTYHDIWTGVAQLARRSGASVQVHRYGTSVRGEPLWCVTVEQPGANPEATILLIANLHAMENLGVAAALATLEEASAGAANWPRRRLVVVPVANPDGFIEVEESLAAGRARFLRGNARGVDLNRNFEVHWSGRCNRLLRRFFSPGPHPLSEPECRALDELAARERPDYVVSLHAFGNRIFIPYLGNPEPPPDLEGIRSLALAMTELQPHTRYSVLRLAEKTRFIKAYGSELDHFYVRYGSWTFLVEIGSGPELGKPHLLRHPYRWYTPSPERVERDVANLIPALNHLASAPPRQEVRRAVATSGL